MARLPEQGGDNGQWGSILNDFLSQSHNGDGTLKNNGLIASKYTKPANGIPKSDLHADVQTALDSAVSGVAPDATTSAKGIVQLAGDLGGTAASPTVPGLAAKANTSSLSAVATSGSYADLSNRPTIPAQFAPVAGANVTLTGTYPAITIAAAASGGTVNSTDAQLRDRSTHTGTQAISTVTNLQTSLNAKLSGQGGLLAVWTGTQTEYNAIGTPSATTLYVVSGV